MRKNRCDNSELNLNHLVYYNAISYLYKEHDLTFYTYSEIKTSMNNQAFKLGIKKKRKNLH